MFEDRIAEMNKQPESVAPAIPYEKRVYTVDEIQDILGVSKTTTYQLIKSKVFHSVRVGGQYRISKKSFDNWLDNLDNSEDCQVCE
jgi:excisionase family DNA binding protein